MAGSSVAGWASASGVVVSLEPFGQASVMGVQAGSQVVGLGPAGLDPPPIAASKRDVDERLQVRNRHVNVGCEFTRCAVALRDAN